MVNLKYSSGDIIKLKNSHDGSKWKVTGFDEIRNQYLLNIDGVNTHENRDAAESNMEKVENEAQVVKHLFSVGDLISANNDLNIIVEVIGINENNKWYKIKNNNRLEDWDIKCTDSLFSLKSRRMISYPTEIEYAENEMEKTTRAQSVSQVELSKPIDIKVKEKEKIEQFKSVKDNGPVKNDFEKEYSKRVVNLAIKNNKVQGLIKKVDDNKKELAALHNGEWFKLYGQYDWRRILFTLFFAALSIIIPGYMAYLWGLQYLVITPFSLTAIAAVIFCLRDKKLDNYIKSNSNDK